MKRARPYVKRKSNTTKKIAKYHSKIPRELSNDRIHVLKRNADGGSFTVSNTVFNGIGQSFSLNQVPAVSELTAMYDQYKICGVKAVFYPPFNNRQNLVVLDSPNISARFGSVIDFNDSSAPATMNELRQYESFKVSACNERHVRYVPYPKFINNSGQNVNDWISTSNPSTLHYGLKWGTEPTLQTSTLSYLVNVELTFYLCFKNIK